MQLKTDGRWTPRIKTDIPVMLLPDNVEGKVINISETGICFDCSAPALSDNILLPIPLSSRHTMKISARKVWHKELQNGRIQLGASFSSLGKHDLSGIRDFIFSKYAEIATSGITERIGTINHIS